MRTALLSLVLLFSLGPACAHGRSGAASEQNGQLLFTAHRYGVEDGLPHRAVKSMVQDDRGFLWMATSQGLARFDGYEFRAYTMANGLSGNDIRSLNIDREGMLWVLSASGKLDIMDPRTGLVETFQEHFAGQAPPEAAGPFSSAKASQDGDIVFTRKGYLFRFRGSQKPFDVIKLDCDRPVVTSVRGDKEAWCHCYPTGAYWGKVVLMRVSFPLAHQGGTVKKYPPISGLGMCAQLQDLSGWRPSQDPGTYFKTKEGMVWTPTGGSPFHGEKRVTRRGGGLFCYLMPLADDVWLVNTTVRRMHAGDNPFTAPVLFDLATIYPEAAKGLQTAFRDRTGNLWVGCRFGLFKINMLLSHFQLLLQQPNGEQPGYAIRGMVVTAGRLHVNTEQQGYWVLNAATGAVVSVDHRNKLRQMMIRDAHGGLWRVSGVDVVHEDATGKEIGRVSGPRRTNAPWSILERKGGGLLIGTAKGLRIAGAHADSTHVCPSGSPSLDQAWIWYLLYTPNGKLLACTNAGLFRLNEQGQVLERWWSGAMRKQDAAHYLPTDDIRYCYVDPDGVFWLATGANGLLRWDHNTGDVRTLGKREGIPRASIHAILPDDEGLLWMPTGKGLVRYDPVSGAAKTFTTSDGLPSNEFNRLAFAQGPNGRFYFGGLNGIAAFNPADLRTPPSKPTAPLVITGVHKQLDKNHGLEDLTAAVLGGGAITMKPSDRFFTVDMALLSYEDPSELRYAWRMEGVDERWNEEEHPHVRINTLPYGDHVLQIKARDAKGRWTEAWLSIPIIMVPPFYLRWWFLLGVVLVIALTIHQWVRYRERQLRRVMAMRDHIASDLHDEVGSMLSSVVLFSSAVGKQADGLSREAMGMLKRIKDNSTRAMENMNDIVWSVNSGHDPMESLFDRMRAYAVPLCETAGIELELDLDKAMGTRKLDMEQRKNLYLIFKEAVNNAVKHAHCAKITVHLREVAGSLELMVLDNGKGTLPADAGRGRLGGNGLGNMRRRAEEIGGTLDVSARTDGGTGVQVVFRSPLGEK